MKKIILFLIVIFSISNVYSQIEKGKKYIGGGISLSSRSNSYLDSIYTSSSNSFSFQLQPNFGYFITNNIAISANISFGIANSTQKFKSPYYGPNDNINKNNSIAIGAGVFAHYYKKIFDKCYLSFNGGFMYRYEIEQLKKTNGDPNYIYPSDDPANQEIVFHDNEVYIYPSVTYFMTPKLAFFTSFGSLGYYNSKSVNNSLNFDNNIKTSYFNLDFNLSSLGFGVNYYF